MIQKNHSRTGLFMTELILVLFFFSVAAACCLQVFAKASILGEKSDKLKLALNTTENLVQQLKASGGSLEGLEGYQEPEAELAGEEKTPDGRTAELYYDKYGNLCRQEEAYYLAGLEVTETDGLYAAQISCREPDGEEIYSLTAEWAAR